MFLRPYRICRKGNHINPQEISDFLRDPLHSMYSYTLEQIQAYVDEIYQPFADKLIFRPEHKHKGLVRCLISILNYTSRHIAEFPQPYWIHGYRVFIVKPLLLAFQNVWTTNNYDIMNSNFKTTKFFSCMNTPNDISHVITIYHAPYIFFEELHEFSKRLLPELPNFTLCTRQHYRTRGRNKPCGCCASNRLDFDESYADLDIEHGFPTISLPFAPEIPVVLDQVDHLCCLVNLQAHLDLPVQQQEVSS